MGAWLQSHSAPRGFTSRQQYRRWLPLIIMAQLSIAWLLYGFGHRGHLNLSDLGWSGLAIAAATLPYFTGWLFLTARRLRSADISRGWLIFAVLTIAPRVGDYTINLTLISSLLLTIVAAFAPDRFSAHAS